MHVGIIAAESTESIRITSKQQHIPRCFKTVYFTISLRFLSLISYKYKTTFQKTGCIDSQHTHKFRMFSGILQLSGILKRTDPYTIIWKKVYNYNPYHSSHSLVMLSPGEYPFPWSLQWHWLTGMQPFSVISSYTVPVKHNNKQTITAPSEMSNFHKEENLRVGTFSTWHRKQRLRLAKLKKSVSNFL